MDPAGLRDITAECVTTINHSPTPHPASSLRATSPFGAVYHFADPSPREVSAQRGEIMRGGIGPARLGSQALPRGARAVCARRPEKENPRRRLPPARV